MARPGVGPGAALRAATARVSVGECTDHVPRFPALVRRLPGHTPSSTGARRARPRGRRDHGGGAVRCAVVTPPAGTGGSRRGQPDVRGGGRRRATGTDGRVGRRSVDAAARAGGVAGRPPRSALPADGAAARRGGEPGRADGGDGRGRAGRGSAGRLGSRLGRTDPVRLRGPVVVHPSAAWPGGGATPCAVGTTGAARPSRGLRHRRRGTRPASGAVRGRAGHRDRGRRGARRRPGTCPGGASGRGGDGRGGGPADSAATPCGPWPATGGRRLSPC